MLSKKLFRIRASMFTPCDYTHAALVAAFSTKIRRRFKIDYLPAGSHFENGALHCTFTVVCLKTNETTSITLVGGEPEPGAGMVAAHKVAEITLLHIWFGIPVISKGVADQLSPMALLCFLVSKASNKLQAFREADSSLIESLSEDEMRELGFRPFTFISPKLLNKLKKCLIYLDTYRSPPLGAILTRLNCCTMLGCCRLTSLFS